ncbi:MAG: methyltransferase domain-containing protein [Patescibacteria group bacterium]|nr:methyltransferase domain-containing protein [Patescibacteria group bacterium]
MKEFNNYTLPLVAEFELLLPRSSRVADLGTGSGANALYLASRGHSVLALDRDKSYLETLRTTAKELGCTALQFVNKDIAELNTVIGEQQYDAMLCLRAFQHVRPKEKVYTAISAMQKATIVGGYNFVFSYCAEEYEQAIRPDLSLLSPTELKELYANEGWNIRHYEYRQGTVDTTGVDSRAVMIAQRI